MRKMNVVLQALCMCLVLTVCMCDDDCQPSPPPQSLCSDFQALAKAIPFSTFAGIVINHNKYDKNFRKTMKFIGSSKFEKLANKIDHSTSYQNILKQFQNNGIDTTDIQTIDAIQNCLSQFYSGDEGMTSQVPDVPPSHSFIDDLFNAINKTALQGILKARIENSEQFEAFYEIITKPSFKTDVLSALKNMELKSLVKKLKRKGVDITKILKKTISLFSNGPTVMDDC